MAGPDRSVKFDYSERPWPHRPQPVRRQLSGSGPMARIRPTSGPVAGNGGPGSVSLTVEGGVLMERCIRRGELLSLSSGRTPAEVVVTLTGELDLASAERAFGYVRDVIDRHGTPVVLDLASLSFCDARGLGALVRMNSYAGQAGCALRLMSPPPRLLEIMRLTNLDSELIVQPGEPRYPAGRLAC